MTSNQLTRRTFVKTMTIGATAVMILKWPPPAEGAMEGATATWDPVQPSASPGWSGGAGQARYRIDGIPKVTGAKIYARDFHPKDIPGWPAAASYAYVLRAVYADRPVTGLALDKLPANLRPQTVVTQTELDEANIQTPYADLPGTIMVEPGAVPAYLGQPVAILIFKDFETWRGASNLMQFDLGYINYGAVTQPATIGILGDPYYFIRYSENGQEVFSQVIAESSVNPDSDKTKADCDGAFYRKKINETIAGHPEWQLFRSETSTQAIDPMFMEPETGMAWMRPVDGALTLDLVLGTQSPNGDAATICSSFQSAGVHPARIGIYSCYPGGGFGGRDTSLFPVLLSIAAAFAQGLVVRLEYDRFGQFQGGIKRNGSQIAQTFAVEKTTGKLQAIQSRMTLVGGGKQNYSPYVAELAGICGAGAYAPAMNDITAKAVHTIGPTAGSMRGFGGPQAFFAVEHLMDEIAATLKVDPIDLRIRNVLAEGGNTVTGAPITQPLALKEICELARANPLWTNREVERKRRSGGDTAYGVGFALANQAFGTGNDGVFGRVELAPDGTISVTTNAVDMGNGSATSLALATARWLGANAASIEMGNSTFSDILNLTNTKGGTPCAPGSIAAAPCPPLTPSTTTAAATPAVTPAPTRGGHALRATLERLRAAVAPAAGTCLPNPPYVNPWTANDCYTSAIYMSSSACITAFQQMHVVEQASRVVFMTGIWPAALKLWGADASLDAATARWGNGQLVASGHPPLALAQLAAEAYRLGAMTGATAHACYQGMWVSADWTVASTTYKGWPLDALAVRAGYGVYTRLQRRNVVSPPPQAHYYGRSLYAPSGTLAAVEIERRTGQLRLIEVVTYVSAGRPIQRQLLAGQYEGAVAMGFGYTFLEHMPQTTGGPGDGTWNLNRYGMALASDLPPLERMRLVTLHEEEEPKGIGEAVLCPIAPALANAASSATGKFYRSLPITMGQLKEGLA
jgi:CO/xanthine dehydrogenase Mo-binding subunit